MTKVSAPVVVKCNDCGKEAQKIHSPFFCGCGGLMFPVRKFAKEKDHKEFFDKFNEGDKNVKNAID